MAPVVELFHIPKFRSTRVLWLYYELEAIYGVSRSDFPKLKLNKLSPDTFRKAYVRLWNLLDQGCLASLWLFSSLFPATNG